MRIYEQGKDAESDICATLTSGASTSLPEVEQIVREIIEQVRTSGDSALVDYGRRFDSPSLSGILVPPETIADASERVDRQILEALEKAAGNIREFHEKEKQGSWRSSNGGVTLGQIVTPVDSVGIYVPGGRATYPSSVLMTAIPASVAGVKRIAIATPAAPDGEVPAVVLAACRIAGVSTVYRMGGASAVAAFAYGTETVERVDKVVGPGSNYVNVAKRLLFGQIGIDSLAGPSEVLIVSDGSVDPTWLASDLIAQAEHGGESKSILITWDREHAEAVVESLERQAPQQPRHSEIEQSLASAGAVIVARDETEAARLANLCAPEHLQLCVSEPEAWLGSIRNVGAVFAGGWSPVPIGDYVAGPSHTLPTGTAARFSSALGVAEFQKRTSLIWYSREAYTADAEAACAIAEAEGLHAHAASLRARFGGNDQ